MNGVQVYVILQTKLLHELHYKPQYISQPDNPPAPTLQTRSPTIIHKYPRSYLTRKSHARHPTTQSALTSDLLDFSHMKHAQNGLSATRI
ncbi:hypothetical protein HBI56_144710 [Parastagonospora nodorum]|uniref:Uncharacterized protein n=1 Tax=Phaeosphaeria nodorum (strain SN15 / ATCC MYA-4574 / FGSC 10173) TaxID=321614 RepID=A0A7U2F7T9_PHANO|nr:hypothetical protein HBH56_032320 [Parastagonospora nodorum]QRD00331.1 hypothetical protein JI435_415020 [Parastagonospora nodorum SN15]KAH3933643.1 hypothetical protein HBH54_067120 [Parastagonospora nodorum]KAH3952555.1 hypothetical protein HBH53_042920 [Parastagonospora nodorum]KAH3979964.1 hypothetical protein HBH51_053950 [Parastagonospora nodorum]